MPWNKDAMSRDKRKSLIVFFSQKIKEMDQLNMRCTDGRPQRLYTDKEDTISPTVSIEAMMLESSLDAKENRYHMLSDIPGAFLHVDMEDNIHMLLEHTIAEMITNLDPTIYRQHIWFSRQGKPMLNVQIKKALYGTLQTELLFWKLIFETLQEWSFKLNPYDNV